jgi:hypothetical protein
LYKHLSELSKLSLKPLNFDLLSHWTLLLVFTIKFKWYVFLCPLYPHPVHLKFQKCPKLQHTPPTQNNTVLDIFFLKIKKLKEKEIKK